MDGLFCHISLGQLSKVHEEIAVSRHLVERFKRAVVTLGSTT